MAERSGFYNALLNAEGKPTIKYNAEDYTGCLAAIISDGVRRGQDLRVSANGGLNLSIAVGFAMVKGHWYWNDSINNSFSVPTAPVGDLARIDRIVLRYNNSPSNPFIKAFYLTGTPAASPTAPALTRNNSVYEISIATINVSSGMTVVSQNNIVDDRSDPELCGWITTPVGYDDFFSNFDDQFNTWFQDKKDTLASVTLFKKYTQRITTQSQTNLIQFNIPQYDDTGVDILEVFVNGVYKVAGIHYSITSKTVLTFVDELVAGTDVDINVYKSIDGTGLGSVSDEITELQNQMSQIKNIGECIYICNGVDDNIKLSDLAKELLTSSTNNDNITINVYGTFGISAPYSGSGLTSSRYRWFDFQPTAQTSKKITFDFLNSTEIRILESNPDSHYIGFYGTDIHIKNAAIYVSGAASRRPQSFQMFSSTSGYLFCENCRFFIYAFSNASIAENGTFNDCYGEVISTNGLGCCFPISNTNALLRLNGGEYRAYKSSGNTNNSYVIRITNVSSIVVTYGVSMPTVSSTYGTQNYAISNAGNGSFFGTITGLPIEKIESAGSHYEYGTIKRSIPNVND